VPVPIKQAILLLIGHLYEHWETISDFQSFETPMAYDALLFPYRILSF